MIDAFYSSKRNSWSANFTHNNKNYYADLVCVTDRNCPEVMIFKADKNFKVHDWEEVYVASPLDVSKETLLEHINKFLESQ